MKSIGQDGRTSSTEFWAPRVSSTTLFGRRRFENWRNVKFYGSTRWFTNIIGFNMLIIHLTSSFIRSCSYYVTPVVDYCQLSAQRTLEEQPLPTHMHRGGIPVLLLGKNFLFIPSFISHPTEPFQPHSLFHNLARQSGHLLSVRQWLL